MPSAGASQLPEPSKRRRSSRGVSLCPGSAIAGAFLLTSGVAIGRCFLKFGNLIRRRHFVLRRRRISAVDAPRNGWRLAVPIFWDNPQDPQPHWEMSGTGPGFGRLCRSWIGARPGDAPRGEHAIHLARPLIHATAI